MVTVDRREEWYLRAAKYICDLALLQHEVISLSELKIIPDWCSPRTVDCKTFVGTNWNHLDDFT